MVEGNEDEWRRRKREVRDSVGSHGPLRATTWGLFSLYDAE